MYIHYATTIIYYKELCEADLSWSGRRFHPLARQRRTFIGDLVND